MSNQWSNWVVQLTFFLLHAVSDPTGAVRTNEDLLTVSLTEFTDQLLTNAPEPIRTIHVICPNGTRWIVPDTIEDQSKAITLYAYSSRGSILKLQLPTNDNVERTKFRGLYECCGDSGIPVHADAKSGLLGWLRRQNQPICCPCCPWYEQHRCLYPKITTHTATQPRDDNRCYELFLFTGTVDTQALRIHIVPGEPMLLPCPAQLNPVPNNPGDFIISVPPLTVHHQFFQHFAFDKPWFPFDSNERDQVAHTYDPRYGLCLHRAQFPRSTLQLACRYRDRNQTRLIQTMWPPSPPTVSPEIHVRLVDPTAASASDLPLPVDGSEPWDIDVGEAIYRVRKGSVLRVHCLGGYTQSRIVKQPPPKLCFHWKWFESDTSNTIADQSTNVTADQWQLNACSPMQSAIRPRRRIAYATNEIDLPPIRRPITVGCQILTPARQAPATQRFIRVVPVVEAENRFNWSITWNSSVSVIVLASNQTVPPSGQINQTIVLLTGNTEAKFNLTVRFWSNHEAIGWPHCSCNQTQPGRVLRQLHRARDAWECHLSWMQHPYHDRNTDIEFGYANWTKQIHVRPIQAINGTTPRLTGLHGNIRQAMHLTCTRTSSELALARVLIGRGSLSSDRPEKYTWLIELRNGPQGLSHALNLSQTESTLALHAPGIDGPNQLWSYSTNDSHEPDRFPNTSQSIPLQGPRAICVQCQSAYANGMTLVGPKHCQPLSDWPLPHLVNHTSDDDQLLLLVRQAQMPIQSQWNNSSERSTLTILKAVPYELHCILLRGLSAPVNRSLSPRLWPSARWWWSTEPDADRFRARNRTWRLSPYSRELRIHLDSLNETGQERPVACHYGNKSIQTSVKSVQPTGPTIRSAEAWIKHSTREPGRFVVMHCSAQARPLPNLTWELQNGEHNEPIWSVLHTCHAPSWPNFTQLYHTCNYTAELMNRSMLRLRCRVTNEAGSVVQVVQPRSETGNGSSPDEIAGTTVHTFRPGTVEARWVVIIASLIVLLLTVLVVASLCLYHRTRRKSRGTRGLRPIANVLYTKTAHCGIPPHSSQEDHGPFCRVVDEKTDAVRELVYLLGSSEKVARWHIPRDRIELTTVRLGLGHYGQVIKGWYTESDDLVNGSTTRIPVAIKTASNEPTSMQCLRNEIQLLPELHGGKNIACMLGLIIGSREDLSDTYLVLHYCAHRSLAEFVRRHAHQITGMNGRIQKTSIHSCDSGVYSINGNEALALADRSSPCKGNSFRQIRTDVEEFGPEKDCTKWRNTESNSGYYRLTHEALYELALGIANGVEYLARHGIIHRDLATRNVLVDASHTPRIGDFGLAVRVWRTDNETLCDDSYRITSFQKQLPFRILPLEALREQTFYLASDVWELGLLFWQLFHLETKRPFGHIRTAEELVHQLQLHFRMVHESRDEAPPQLERPGLVDDALWKMMCRAWQADPKLRPDAWEFRATIEGSLVQIRQGKQPNEDRTETAEEHELNYITCVDLTASGLDNPASSNQAAVQPDMDRLSE